MEDRSPDRAGLPVLEEGPLPPTPLRNEPISFFGWFRQTARLWGFLAFFLLILVLFREIILPFVIALLIAYILAPLLRWLCALRIGRFHAPRFLWIIVVYAALLGLLGIFFTSFVPRLSLDLKRILYEAPVFWQKVRERWVPEVASWYEAHFGDLVPEAKEEPGPKIHPRPPTIRIRTLAKGELELDLSTLGLELLKKGESEWLIRAPSHEKRDPAVKKDRFTVAINRIVSDAAKQSESRLNQALQVGQRLVIGVLNAITTFILLLLVSAFILVDTERILRWFRNLFPPGSTADFDAVLELTDRGLSGVIRGQFIICLINGALTWVGLHLIGVKYPLLLGLLAGLMSLIPIFGSILSSVPIVIVALASGAEGLDFLKGVLTLAWIIGIHLLEANLLNPKIMGTAAKIHPVVVIFAVVAGEHTGGAVGALLGVPLVSTVQALFTYLRQKAQGGPRGALVETAESPDAAEGR